MPLPEGWCWEAYRGDVWHACAAATLQRLLGREGQHVAEEEAREHAAMERIVRLVRSGAFGPLLFEGGPSARPAAKQAGG